MSPMQLCWKLIVKEQGRGTSAIEAGTIARERLQATTSRLTAGRLTSEGRHYHLNSAVMEHLQCQDAVTAIGEELKEEMMSYVIRNNALWQMRQQQRMLI